MDRVIGDFGPDVVVTSGPLSALGFMDKVPRRVLVSWIGYASFEGSPVSLESRTVLRAMDAAVVPSAWCRSALNGGTSDGPQGNLKARVIPHGVDTRLFHPRPDRSALRAAHDLAKRFVVGCVAQNGYRKQFPILLKAFSTFAERHPEALLYLHTDPDGPAWQLLELVKQHGLERQVAFTQGLVGPVGVSGPVLNIIYNLFDAMVLPTMGEAFGLPILEAMAAGIPVIATACSAVTELVEGRGELIAVRDWLTMPWDSAEYALPDTDDLVAKLELLHANPELRLEYGQRGRAFAKTMAWGRAAVAWERLLDSVTSRSPRAARAVSASWVSAVRRAAASSVCGMLAERVVSSRGLQLLLVAGPEEDPDEVKRIALRLARPFRAQGYECLALCWSLSEREPGFEEGVLLLGRHHLLPDQSCLPASTALDEDTIIGLQELLSQLGPCRVGITYYGTHQEGRKLLQLAREEELAKEFQGYPQERLSWVPSRAPRAPASHPAVVLCTPFAGYESPYLLRWMASYAAAMEGLEAEAIWYHTGDSRHFAKELQRRANEMPVPVRVVHEPLQLSGPAGAMRKNLAVCAAWQRLIEEVGDPQAWMLCIESDVVVPVGGPQRLFEGMLSHRGIGALSAAIPDYRGAAGTGTMAWRLRAEEHQSQEGLPIWVGPVGWYHPEFTEGIELVDSVPAGCLLIRASTFLVVPPRDTLYLRFGWDQELCLNLWRAGLPCAIDWGCICGHLRDVYSKPDFEDLRLRMTTVPVREVCLR